MLLGMYIIIIIGSSNIMNLKRVEENTVAVLKNHLHS